MIVVLAVLAVTMLTARTRPTLSLTIGGAAIAYLVIEHGSLIRSLFLEF